MGYYTDFNIEATGFKNEEEAEFFLFKLNRESGYNFSADIGITTLDASLSEAKFYEYKDVFVELSEAFPKVQITVSGEGEESGDIWQHRFQNGVDEHVTAELTFPEFKQLNWEIQNGLRN